MNAPEVRRFAEARRDDETTNTTFRCVFQKELVVSSSRRPVVSRRRRAVGACLLAVAVTGLSACSTTKAATPIERPALEVPPPPPRIVTPLPPPPTPSPEPVDDLPPLPNGTTPKPRPPQREKQPEPAKPADPKPEVPPETAPPAAPQQPLRIPETSDPQQLANEIGASIANARAILSKTDHRRLNDAQKKAYRDSQLFAQQAEEALKASNLVFAKELAEKAERLAKELQGR